MGSESNQTGAEWWHEWIEIHNDRIMLHYWLNQLNEMTKLADKVHIAIDQYGNPSQRARFFDSLVMMAYRRDHYAISEETIIHSRTALSASQESANLNLISFCQFLPGFNCLWYGDLNEAEKQLQQSLKLTEQTGDIVLQSLCLTYLTITYRMQGKLKSSPLYSSL